MPGYIGYRPQFNPISLQEYLTVPTTILGEYTKAEDAYNETATKTEALKALLGERNADNKAGWRIVDNYEKQLGDIANNIAQGIQGPEAYRQARSAQRYYRENMLPLESGIPAYQKELERYNSDPSMIGARPMLENYIKNPLYKGYMLSGDKIYADMVNQGKMAAADRSASEIKAAGAAGYINHVKSVGYSPKEQQEYLGLIQAALKGETYTVSDDNGNLRVVDASSYLNGNNKYSQLYQGLNAYMKDHAFDQLDNNGKLNALDRAISGQLYGMTGSTEEKYLDDKVWAAAQRGSVSGSKGRSKKEDDLYKYFMSQSLPSPDYDSESKSNKDKSVASKVLAGPVTNNNKTIQTVLNTVGNITGIKPYSNFSGTKTYEGTLSASADYYKHEADKTESANKSNNKLIEELNEKFNRNVKASYIKFNNKSLDEIKSYGKTAFGKYKTIEDIPDDIKDNFIRDLRTAGHVSGMIPTTLNQEQINLLVYIGFRGTFGYTRNATPPNSAYLTKKEFDDLKKKGVMFYNPDGSVRDERDILWDAWDIIMPKQYDKYSITTTQGAGKSYGVSATKEYLDEFPNSGNVKTTSGETVQLKPNKDRTGFVGYGDPQYYLSGRTIRQGKKIMTITSDSGDTTHTIDIPLSRREKNIINNQVKDIRAEWLTALVSKGIMSMEEATIIKNYSVPDFLKFVELVNQYPNLYGGRWSSLVPNINEIIDELDDALVIGNEVNFIQSNSETEGKLYN